MNPQEIKEMQNKFLQYQQSIIEKVTSANNEVGVTMNGSVEVTEIDYNENLSKSELNTLLIPTINQCIKNVSEKIKQGVMAIQQQAMQKPL